MQNNNLSNQIQSIPIYKYLKDYISIVPRAAFRKGEYLFRGEGKEKTIFYILDGIVAIENITYNGKKLIIENIEKNTFTGPIADRYNISLQSSGVAVTDVEALAISKDMLDRLLENDKFAIHFYQETSGRVFGMYKKVLAKLLFSPNEILTYYVLENSQDEVFAYKSAYSLCDKIGISRRGFYDIMCRLEKMGCIRKVESSVYRIIDRGSLENQAEHMISFMEN